MSDAPKLKDLTVSEFLASQQTWFELHRSATFVRHLRLAVKDFYQWRMIDEKMTDVTLDLIDQYSQLDDSWRHKTHAQRLRALRRRYLAMRKTGEPFEVPPASEPPIDHPPELQPAPGPSYQPELLLNYLAQLYAATNPRLRSKHSRALLGYAVDRFQEYLGRAGVLGDLSDTSLVAFAEYRKTLGRSDRTIERELSKLATLWRWAANRGWCPAVHFFVQKCAPPTPTAWSPEEMEKIFQAAAEYRSTLGGVPARLVLVAALRLAYDTGERASALFALRWEDIDIGRRFVTFRAETRKGGIRTTDNLQRFSRKTAKALGELRRHLDLLGKDLVCLFPEVHRTSVYGHLKLVLKNCGLDGGRNCMFHKIRRTHATHLYLAGGDPTQSLGHESDAMTRGYYLDPKQTRNGFLADLLGIGGLFRRLRRGVKRALGII